MKFADVVVSAAICTGIAAVFGTVVVQSVGQGSGVKLALDMQRHRVVAHAILQYAEDNGNRYPQFSHTYSYSVTAHPPDRAWGQLVLPFHGNMDNYREPEDPATYAQLMTFMPGCANNPLQCEFNLAAKSHKGYNYVYLSPTGYNCSAQLFVPRPILTGQVQNPPKTVLLVDSAFGSRPRGVPEYGGSYTVDPPARFTSNQIDTFPPLPGCSNRWHGGGWDPTRPNSAQFMGNAWYWHKNQTMVVTFGDGHVGILSPGQLSAGATVAYQFGGQIYDRERYLWDLE